MLGATLEVLRLPDDLVARLDGKSSLGRLGLQVHSTAGLADPGFEGQITLELSNIASLPIAIYPGMRIAQLVFERLTTPADRPYGAGSLGSKYQGQRGPTRERVLAQLRSARKVIVRAGGYPILGYILDTAERRWSVSCPVVCVLRVRRAEVLAGRGGSPEPRGIA